MPSPPSQQTPPRPILRRSSSFPPPQNPSPKENPIKPTLTAPLTPASVEIEELSPEAIIPDSLPVFRDPQIEIPEDEYSEAEADLEKKFTAFKLDRMTDGTDSEGSEKGIREGKGEEKGKKRKFTPDGEGEEGPERKRTTSPGSFALSKEND